MSLTKQTLRSKTRSDTVLSKVIAFVERSWPSDRKILSDDLQVYFDKRFKLSFEDGIAM